MRSPIAAGIDPCRPLYPRSSWVTWPLETDVDAVPATHGSVRQPVVVVRPVLSVCRFIKSDKGFPLRHGSTVPARSFVLADGLEPIVVLCAMRHTQLGIAVSELFEGKGRE